MVSYCNLVHLFPLVVMSCMIYYTRSDGTEVDGMVKNFFARRNNLLNLAWFSFHLCSGLREKNLLMAKIGIVGIRRIPRFHHFTHNIVQCTTLFFYLYIGTCFRLLFNMYIRFLSVRGIGLGSLHGY